MNGRAAGAATPILFGIGLLYKCLPESRLFNNGKNADLASALAGLGAFLLLLGVIFVIRNWR